MGRGEESEWVGGGVRVGREGEESEWVFLPFDNGPQVVLELGLVHRSCSRLAIDQLVTILHGK